MILKAANWTMCLKLRWEILFSIVLKALIQLLKCITVILWILYNTLGNRITVFTYDLMNSLTRVNYPDRNAVANYGNEFT